MPGESDHTGILDKARTAMTPRRVQFLGAAALGIETAVLNLPMYVGMAEAFGLYFAVSLIYDERGEAENQASQHTLDNRGED